MLVYNLYKNQLFKLPIFLLYNKSFINKNQLFYFYNYFNIKIKFKSSKRLFLNFRQKYNYNYVHLNKSNHHYISNKVMKRFLDLLANLYYYDVYILVYAHNFLRGYTISNLSLYSNTRLFPFIMNNNKMLDNKAGYDMSLDAQFRELAFFDNISIVCLDETYNITMAFLGIRWNLFTVFATGDRRLIKFSHVSLDLNSRSYSQQILMCSMVLSFKVFSVGLFFSIASYRNIYLN